MGNAQYQYTLQDENLDELNTWAPKMLAKLKTVKESEGRFDRSAGSRLASTTSDRSRQRGTIRDYGGSDR